MELSDVLLENAVDRRAFLRLTAAGVSAAACAGFAAGWPQPAEAGILQDLPQWVPQVASVVTRVIGAWASFASPPGILVTAARLASTIATAISTPNGAQSAALSKPLASSPIAAAGNKLSTLLDEIAQQPAQLGQSPHVAEAARLQQITGTDLANLEAGGVVLVGRTKALLRSYLPSGKVDFSSDAASENVLLVASRSGGHSCDINLASCRPSQMPGVQLSNATYSFLPSVFALVPNLIGAYTSIVAADPSAKKQLTSLEEAVNTLSQVAALLPSANDALDAKAPVFQRLQSLLDVVKLLPDSHPSYTGDAAIQIAQAKANVTTSRYTLQRLETGIPAVVFQADIKLRPVQGQYYYGGMRAPWDVVDKTSPSEISRVYIVAMRENRPPHDVAGQFIVSELKTQNSTSNTP